MRIERVCRGARGRAGRRPDSGRDGSGGMDDGRKWGRFATRRSRRWRRTIAPSRWPRDSRWRACAAQLPWPVPARVFRWGIDRLVAGTARARAIGIVPRIRAIACDSFVGARELANARRAALAERLHAARPATARARRRAAGARRSPRCSACSNGRGAWCGSRPICGSRAGRPTRRSPASRALHAARRDHRGRVPRLDRRQPQVRHRVPRLDGSHAA